MPIQPYYRKNALQPFPIPFFPILKVVTTMLFPYNIFFRTFVLFYFLFFCCNKSSTAQTRLADSLELVAFYNSNCGGCTLGWNFTQPMTSWSGVSLNLGRVTSLNLNNRNLSGTIPNFNLNALEELSLPNNQFTGSIPNFSNLPNLQILELYNNQLSGTIPDFSNLPNAFRIYLGNNQLIGSIPNFSSIPTLVFLRFEQNQLTGSIPDFTNLPQLRQLHLQDNQLSGNIPNFSNIPQVTELYLENNQLTGFIPNFSNLPSLRFLRLQNNQLTDIIPDFAGCSNLSLVSLQDNQFTFEDFITNHSGLISKAGSNYQYAPQDSIGTASINSIAPGTNYTIDLVVDDLVPNNIYYWFKDGILIDSTFGVNEYTILNFQAANAGVYTAKVVNSVVTNPNTTNQALVLNSRPVQLNLANFGGTATIPGLPTTVCANRTDTILFYRDPAFLYSRTATGSGFIDSNELVMSYSNNAPFITINNATNNEVYGFIPSRLSPGDTVVVTADYTSTETDNSITPPLIGIVGFTRARVTIYVDSALSNVVISVPNSITDFCANDFSNTPLSGTPATGGTGAFSGPGTNGTSQFNPADAGAGTHAVVYKFTNNNGCYGSDSILLQVSAPPVADIDANFNFIPSPYNNGNSTSEHTYCSSSLTFSINGQPSHTTGSAPTNITGAGVVQSGNNYNYNPSLVIAEADTVVYTYTDNVGCTDTDTAFIKIDAVPNVTLGGLPSPASLCTNNAPVQLTGSPVATTPNIGRFRGPGVDSITGLFTPSLLTAGTYNLVYEYTGNAGCSANDTIPITLFTAPLPLFTPPNASYLSNSPLDTLFSSNDTINGTYQFYGSPVINSFGLIDPSLATGPQRIYYSYTNSNGCTGIDSADFTIMQNNNNPNNLPLVFTNNDPAAPNLTEACAGSSVSFDYNNFSGHPASISFPSKPVGTRLTITAAALTLTNQGTGSNSGVRGTVSFIIPNNAASGTVIFLDGNGSPIDTTDYSLVIHNPTLDFTTLPSLLCASNTSISLQGSPAGGTFTGVGNAANAVSGNTFDATQMPWPTAHRDSLSARIGYSYTPMYSDNITPCAQAISMTRTMPVYDNRLNRVEFATLSQQDATAGNKVLSLDTSLSNMITLVTPNIFCNSNPNSPIVPCLPHTFSGTFVDQNNNFLSTIAGGRNLVRLEYNNQGCIGSADGFIDILGKLVIQNLPDTLCASSGIVTFGRDTNLVYLDTTFAVGTETRRVIRNQLLNTYTSDPNNSAAINPINPIIAGQEQFDFSPIFSKVIVNMQYQNLTTVTDTLGVVTTIVADTFVVTDSVILTGANQSILFINNLRSAYCANEIGDTLFPSLGFVGLTSNVLYVYRSSTNDTIYLDDHYLNPTTIYDSLGTGTDNLDLRVGYEVDYYGCADRLPFADQPLLTITAPQTPSFSSQSPYCRDDAPDMLQRAALGPGVSEAFSGGGVDPATGIFSPKSAGLGNNIITYVLTDSNGCTYFYTNGIMVNDGPEVNLLLNGSDLLDEFCYSIDSVGLDTSLTRNPNPITSMNFFGVGLRSQGTAIVFDPSIIYNNGDTTTTVWVEVTDNVGCFSSDTAYVTVIPPPTIDIDSAFNFISSVYGVNGLDTSEHSYCKSVDTFFIDGQPSYLTGNAGNTITGTGVVLVGNNYYYNPALIPNSVEADTVLFTYTDIQGCSNIDTAIIKLDSIPVVTLTGLPSTLLCNNNDTIPLIGSPIDTFNNRGTFIGAGVDSSSGIFVPAVAGIGTHILIYDYTAASGCSNRDSVQVTIVNKPTSEPRGYQPSYCINAANDTLFSANDTSGTYQFSGDLIIAGTDILTVSNLPDTNTLLLRELYYTYTSATGCTIDDTITIQINPKPEIYFNDLDTAYCSNGSVQNFRVSPNGGSLVNRDTAFSILTDNRFIALDPTLADTGYTSLTYAFTAPNTCADTVTVPIYIQPVVLPSIAGLDSSYCKTNDTISLTASLSGGYFIGSGVDSTTNGDWFFIPLNAQNGLNRIQYIIPGQVTAPGQPLVCRADTTVIVNIEAPLNINLVSPTLVSKFCSNDPAVQFLYDTLNSSVVHTFRADTSTLSSAVFWSANTYFFDPSNASIGANVIIYSVEDTITGCKDSTEHIFVVDEYITPRIRNLDSSYCEEDIVIAISGVPSGSTITRDGVPIPPINPQIPNRLGFRPNGLGLPLHPLTTSIQDTIVSSYTQGGCSDSVTIIVDIHPVFNVNFTVDSNNLQKIFCLGGDTVDLIPSRSGGLFSGTGVRSGTSFFIPDLAEAGIHPISFEYTDSITNCYSIFTDTFYVYGVPNVDFEVQGGCQFDSIEFVPDNDLLGLDNIFQNNFIDSVTSVWWSVSDSVQIVGSGQRDSITPLRYQYASAGVYNTQLIVTNREICADTQTIRIVISPKISTFPYVEDFETGNGNWFAESRDSTHRLLWEWGIDSTSLGGPNDNSNHIWATQTNASYAESEDAWVYSPCFDISNLDRPMISLNYWSNVRPSDGAILEYQGADGRWLPLGAVNRGIDWYNSGAVYARPGDQVLPGSATSMGWIGLQQFDWKDGRCKLDGIAHNSSTRFRIAFASLPNPINGFLDGFAFDNVVIRSRNRNVLIETMVHDQHEDIDGIYKIDMETINNLNYQLIHHSELNKDVVLLQYHIERANGTNTGIEDFFHLHNADLAKTRSLEYSAPPGKAYINGVDSAYTTRTLAEVDFEQDMLETAKFAIAIDTFRHINNNFQIVARVVALVDTMSAADYRIYTVISEDSLSYPIGGSYTSQVHAVVRENDEYHLNPFRNTNNIIYNHTWTVGETRRVEFNWNHNAHNFINYRPNRFHAVVFIQNTGTKEIFQVATTRDVSGYWVGIDPIQAKDEYNELQSLKLFPNPAHDYFKLQFDQVLEHDYDWKLVNMQGVEVQQGQIQAGHDQVQIDGLDYPSGAYILLLYNKNVFVQRKVILGRP
jgi:hypothetical protein